MMCVTWSPDCIPFAFAGFVQRASAILAVSIAFVFVDPARAAEEPDLELRRESSGKFDADIPALRRGAVQYFFGLVTPEGKSFEGGSTDECSEVERVFEECKHLDTKATWRTMKDERLYALVTRLVYVAGQPVDFFTEKRSRDVNFMNDVAPDFRVTQLENDQYEIAGSLLKGIPESRFTMQYLSGKDAHTYQMPLGVGGLPQPADVVVLQHNFYFGRIMGFKTSAASYSASAHFPVGHSQTLVMNCSIGYIYHIPPFDAAKIIRETAIEYSTKLIGKLRTYSGQKADASVDPGSR